MAAFSSLLAPLKLVPLSLYIWRGVPLLHVKFLRQIMQELVVRLEVTSIWTALVTRQVKSNIHLFSRRRRFEMYIGPKKSTPVKVNGKVKELTRAGGRGDIIGTLGLADSFLQY